MSSGDRLAQRDGITVTTARMEASRCLFCYDAPCNRACPAEVDVVGFIQRIKTGNLQGSITLVRRKNVLAEVCGYLCPTETLCEEACCRAGLDRPVAIGALQAFVGRHQRVHDSIVPQPLAPCRPGRVAVVGAGPGGLGAAMRLMELGYAVEIFDRNELPGGLIAYTIPPHRVDREALLFETHLVQEAGAKFHMNTEIDDLGTLLETFDAVVAGVGWGNPLRLGVEGEDLEGMYGADEILRTVCTADLDGGTPDLNLGKTVLVFGGGNTAIDCAIAARRLGAIDVTVVYRRTEAEMPALDKKVRGAREEGVSFSFLTQPIRMCGEDGRLVAVECVRMRLASVDETGRHVPSPVADSAFLLPADSAVSALGYAPHPWVASGQAEPGTLPDGVFTCGDMLTRRGTIIEALASGRATAEAVHRYLGANGAKEQTRARDT